PLLPGARALRAARGSPAVLGLLAAAAAQHAVQRPAARLRRPRSLPEGALAARLPAPREAPGRPPSERRGGGRGPRGLPPRGDGPRPRRPKRARGTGGPERALGHDASAGHAPLGGRGGLVAAAEG